MANKLVTFEEWCMPWIECLERRIEDLNRFNEYNVPLHACNGYRQDEHYWEWLKAKRLGLA